MLLDGSPGPGGVGLAREATAGLVAVIDDQECLVTDAQHLDRFDPHRLVDTVVQIVRKLERMVGTGAVRVAEPGARPSG